MKQNTIYGGYIESEIEKHPIYKKISEERDNISNEFKDNEMKLYFVLDRFIYRNENREIIFDTGFYQKNYDLIFSKDPYDFFREYSLRLMSLHTLIMRRSLPFVAIGIWKTGSMKYPFMGQISEDLEFKLLQLKDKWEFLTNDIEVIERNIKFRSIFQKALIWYALAELSKTYLETFMNYYRFIEILSNELYKDVEAKVNIFIKNELYFFEEKEIINKFRVPNREKIKSFLKSEHVEHDKIEKIIQFRNRISHGDDYTLEFNDNLITAIDEMEVFINGIINQKIKKMNLEGLKNPNFLCSYYITISPLQKKIVLSDEYDLDYLRTELKNKDTAGPICSYCLGQIAEKDIFSSKMLQQIEYISIDEKICTDLIKNFGKIIEY